MTSLRPGAHVSDRWARWRASVDLDAYQRRFEHMAAQGEHPHGEADLVASYEPTSVLDAGCGTGRVAIELRRRGIDVEGVDLDDDLLAVARRLAPDVVWHHADLATMALPRRYQLVAMPGNVMIFCRPEHRAAIVHTCARHLEPGGLLVAGFTLEPRGLTLDEYDAACIAAGLEFVEWFATWQRDPYEGGDYAVSVHRRPFT